MKKKKKEKIEYYVLAGDKGMKKVLIEKGIEISLLHLMIIAGTSKLGRLIKKEALKRHSFLTGRQK